MELCIECKIRPVHIKKRKLCVRCYQRFRNKTGALLKPDHTFCRPEYQPRKSEPTEVQFIKAYFDHQDWIYQPARFKLNGSGYTPDFYDCRRNVFIEVAGTRQAYHQNKGKYSKMKELYPNLAFEIRKPDGSLLNPEHPEWPK